MLDIDTQKVAATEQHTVPPKADSKKQAVKKGSKKTKTVKASTEKKARKAKVKPTSSSKTDEFGFRKGSKTSMAAAMYADGGATTEEIKKEFGHAHLNLFKKVKAPWVKKVEKVKTKKGGEVTKYFLVRETNVK